MGNLIIYSLLIFVLMFYCAKFSYKFKLLDLPNKRKIHSKATVYTGGIVVSFALILSILLFNTSDRILNLIFSFAFLISVVGLIDDFFILNPGSKLSLQIIPATYLIFFQNLILNQLGDYNYFILKLGAFQIPFTLMCVLFLINAFNYFDGIDGALSFTSISVFAILYFLISDKNFQFLLLIILIPISIFLFFNFSLFKLPKMFLGNSGSLLIGFIVSFILIYVANRNLIHPILLAWSIGIFVFEFLAINFIRLKNKKNLFKPTQDHLHHILFKKTKSIFLTNFIMFSKNIIFFAFGYSVFLLTGPLMSLLSYILLFVIFLIIRNKFS
jgi:UDP-GlcNAc:undecaprenyl-phosphate GlcNAc-1-phosphate transferase